MKTISEIKQYHLNTKEIEAMLQSQYGNNIKPVNHYLVQKQQMQQQIAKNIFLAGKSIKLAEELGEEVFEEL
jgi:hypothetical protein